MVGTHTTVWVEQKRFITTLAVPCLKWVWKWRRSFTPGQQCEFKSRRKIHGHIIQLVQGIRRGWSQRMTFNSIITSLNRSIKSWLLPTCEFILFLIYFMRLFNYYWSRPSPDPGTRPDKSKYYIWRMSLSNLKTIRVEPSVTPPWRRVP